MIPLRSNGVEKIPWRGVLISIQPRIRLSRSFDQRSHSYLGYALRVGGSIGGEDREFLVGVGEGAHLTLAIAIVLSIIAALSAGAPLWEGIVVGVVIGVFAVAIMAAIRFAARSRHQG